MTIKDIFMNLDDIPTYQSDTDAKQWIYEHCQIARPFINGEFLDGEETFESTNPATGERLCGVVQTSQEQITAAVTAAQTAQKHWASCGHTRARSLYALARLLQKHARILSVLETLDTGKPIREFADVDLPLAIRHIYHYAGHAQLMQTALKEREALGVFGQIISWNSPLLMLTWKIVPALAMGNTVVLKPAKDTPLTAMYFAQLCQQAGIRDGVINMITGDSDVGAALVACDVDKIAFTGSTEVGKAIRKVTAGSHKEISLDLGVNSAFIVFDDADLDAAVEGVVDAICLNQGQMCCTGSRLLVQESIEHTFLEKLKARMKKIRVAPPLDKSSDMGALINLKYKKRVESMVSHISPSDITQTAAPEGCYYPATLICNQAPSCALMQDETVGPIISAMSFRTPKEAIELANNTRYGLTASLWSENINTALALAPQLEAHTVWINSTNLMDAASGFGEGRFGREGGWEGLRAYTKQRLNEPTCIAQKESTFSPKSAPQKARINQTIKFYIGGKYTRPDNGLSHEVSTKENIKIHGIPCANAKDLRNAVEAMSAAKSWTQTTAHLRAQILYYIAENLEQRTQDLTHTINLQGYDGPNEVEGAQRALFDAAAWADKFDGQIHATPFSGQTLTLKKPVGRVVAFCDDRPLLGMIDVLGPALALGNQITLITPMRSAPTLATLAQVLETSDVPAGVVNLLCTHHEDLAQVAARHMNINVLWSFSSRPISKTIQSHSITNLKRTYVAQKPKVEDLLHEACHVQNVWISAKL